MNGPQRNSNRHVITDSLDSVRSVNYVYIDRVRHLTELASLSGRTSIDPRHSVDKYESEGAVLDRVIAYLDADVVAATVKARQDQAYRPSEEFGLAPG